MRFPILKLIPAAALCAALLAVGTTRAGESSAQPASSPAAAAAAQEAERLIAAFLAPVPAPTPNAAQRAELELILAGFSAEKFEAREQASATAVKLGTVALTALRQVTGDKDMEVVGRAEQAIAAIEKIYREGLAAELLKLGEPAGALLKARIDEQQRAWARLAMGVPAAERDGKEAEVERLKAEMAKANAQAEALKTVQEQMLRAAVATRPGTGETSAKPLPSGGISQ